MKAITKYKYGGPEVLQLEEIDRPTFGESEILVRVLANSANPADWHILRGKPFLARFEFGLFKPKNSVLGADFAGIVEKVGSQVKRFKIGDRVFGETNRGGAFAEYATVPETNCGLMPEQSSFLIMACLPIAGLTALQALTTHGKLQAGESILINGASGGVGHFSVQIAKAIDAHVTAVCSSRNQEFVKSLGADQAIAYDQHDIHQFDGEFDVVLDTHGNLNFDDFTRMGKRGVITGFTTMTHMISVMLKKSFSKFPLTQFTAVPISEDLETLAKLVAEGKVIPHIEKTFPYHEIPKAVGYIESMRTRGKVAMSWAEL